MSRTVAAGIQNKFTKGLITEATGLNFPEDAVTDTDNAVFNEKGIVTRRLGIDFEPSFSLQTANRTNVAVADFYWQAAAGNGDNALTVLQVGSTLYFYKQDDDTLSDDMIDTIDLTTFSPSGAPSPATTECDFAFGSGYLFVSHPDLESFYCTYDGGTSVTGTQIDLEFRDFVGVDDGLAVDERPATLSDSHHYNLFNQGWDTDDIPASGGGGLVHVLTQWEAVRADEPSNTNIWWLCLNASGEFSPTFKAATIGNSPAPRGHYTLNVYEQDRSTASGVPNIAVVSSNDERAATIGFFAGRVWYSGIKGQDFSNKIYFSQIIESVKQVGFCYQQNDPTTEDRADLLPSDGGVISILEAGEIIKLFPLDSSMLVFTTNGVWAISGSQGIGFTANDYSVVRVSAIPAMSRSSFVSISGVPAWWNEDGIFIASGGAGGQVQINSLTDQTIKSFFDEIPDENKAFARGFFNGRTRVTQWLYRSTTSANMTEAYTFDRVLNYNILTNAFYPWTVDSSPVSLNGIVAIRNPSSVTKYVCSYADSGSYKFTFAEERDDDYLDWFSKDSVGVDYSSYFVSGYALHGDAERKFQPTFVYIFNKTEGTQNVFDFRSQWNFATSGDTGRWSSTQRVTIPDADYSYQFRRLKTRGSGISLQFRIDSVTGEPFRIIGWSNYETQNSSV